MTSDTDADAGARRLRRWLDIILTYIPLRVSLRDADGRRHGGQRCRLLDAAGAPAAVLAFEHDGIPAASGGPDDRQLRAFLEAAPDAMVVVDAAGELRYVNAEAERLFGYPRAELLARPVERLLPERVAARHRAHRRRFLNNPHRRAMGEIDGLSGRRRDGRVFPVDVSLSPLTVDGEPWTIAAVRDISAQRRTAEALRAEREFSDRLLDSAPVIILVLDRDGCIRRFNRHLENVTGCAAAEALGNNWFQQFIAPEDRTLMEAFFADVMRSGINHGFVNAILTRAGQRREIEWYGRTLTGAQGERLLLSIGYDVTELRASARALTVAKRHAEKASAAKSRFLAAASHDLRQPLQTLELLNGVLVRHNASSTDCRDVLVRQLEAIHTMNRLLGTLLNVNQLENGSIEPQIAPFPVAALFEPLYATFVDQARQKGLQLRVARSSALLQSDLGILTEILSNLLVNAIKYTERGSILLGCRRRGDRLRLEVWDTGPGIPDDRRRQIFEEFVRLDNGEPSHRRGLGLGLSIVERLARLLGYPLELRSTPGRGSVFMLSVPPATGPDAAPVHTAAPAAVAPFTQLPPGAAEHATILYIEDDPAVLDAARLLLEIEGYRVVAVGDAATALREVTARGCRPGLLISDYRLPGGLTGLSAIGRLREVLGYAVPALLISGEIGMALNGETGADTTDVEMLNKPVDGERLLAAVRRLAQPPAP